ncbi:MAG: enoyl-CoA hydratase/isomerase family protein [Pseudomonadota bacterium]
MSEPNPPPNELLYASENGIATLTLNRPARRNALTPPLTRLLHEAWQKIEADPAVRVAILTSTFCGTFCAGMDLREAARLKAETGKDVLEHLTDPFNHGMRSMRKPVIAALNGHFLAGGMALALSCDLRVGLSGTQAGITEVKVGRGSPWAVPLLWMMPQALLKEAVLTGDMLPVERLHQVGFLNYLEATPEAVLARAQELAQRIAAAAPLSVMAAKQCLNEATSLGCAEGLLNAEKIYRPVYASADAIEGPRAFAEKRAPRWQGR